MVKVLLEIGEDPVISVVGQHGRTAFMKQACGCIHQWSNYCLRTVGPISDDNRITPLYNPTGMRKLHNCCLIMEPKP